jgi:hypothetical protein
MLEPAQGLSETQVTLRRALHRHAGWLTARLSLAFPSEVSSCLPSEW